MNKGSCSGGQPDINAAAAHVGVGADLVGLLDQSRGGVLIKAGQGDGKSNFETESLGARAVQRHVDCDKAFAWHLCAAVGGQKHQRAPEAGRIASRQALLGIDLVIGSSGRSSPGALIARTDGAIQELRSPKVAGRLPGDEEILRTKSINVSGRNALAAERAGQVRGERRHSVAGRTVWSATLHRDTSGSSIIAGDMIVLDLLSCV
jgi:hypothetical protein